MQSSNRFTIAVHICICILVFEHDHKITSLFLAGSTGAHPVIIRKILQQLKSAGLVGVHRGSGGAYLLQDPSEVSLLDIYKAVELTPKEGVFPFSETLNPQCPVASHMHALMDDHLQQAQVAMENSLRHVTLKTLHTQAQSLIAEENKVGCNY